MPILVCVGDSVLAKVICWSSAISLVPLCWISEALEPTVSLRRVGTDRVAIDGHPLAWRSPGAGAVGPMWLVHPRVMRSLYARARSQVTAPAVLIHQMLNQSKALGMINNVIARD